jgi:hypothetical protein
LNFNGPSKLSNVAYRFACEGPKSFKSLKIVHVEAALIKLTWRQPLNDGGCTIQSYELWADDGMLGDLTPLSLDLGPSTFSFDVIGLQVGLEYRFKVVAKNENGAVESNIVETILADVPQTPTTAPSLVVLETSSNSIRVKIEQVTDDGGAPVLSYQL